MTMETNEYRRKVDGLVVNEDQLRKQFPNESLPSPLDRATLTKKGYDAVLNSPPPSVTFGFKSVRNGVAMEVDGNGVPTGNWIKSWSVIAMTDNEKDEARIAALTDFQNMAVERAQIRLDKFAHSHGYGDKYGNNAILSACTYVNDPNPRFAAEGTYCVLVRSQTWAKLYQIHDQVVAGTRPMPSSFEEIEAELPVLIWPA
jgi:hypothetical protein